MELETLKVNGKLPYGAISNIVASKAATLTWLTKPMVQYHLQKLNQAVKSYNSLVQLAASMTPNDSQSLAGHISSVSTLTANSSINVHLPVDAFVSSDVTSVARMRNNEGKEKEANNENGRVRKNEEKEQEANNEDGLTCEDLGNVRETDNDDATLYGRLKGSTNAMSRDNEQRIARAIAEASQQYRVVKNHAKHNNTYVARGELTKKIQVYK